MLTEQQMNQFRSITGSALVKIKQSPEGEYDSKSQTEGGNSVVGGLITGARKGLVSTLTNISSIGESGIKAVGRAVTPKQYESALGFEKIDQSSAESLVPETMRTPTGTAEKIGFGAEQIAEFFIPVSTEAKFISLMDEVAKAAGVVKGARAVNLATRVGASGASTAGVSLAHEGEVTDSVFKDALIGGAIPIFGAIVGPLMSKALKVTSEKIETALVKPGLKDLKDGFKVSNVFKYNVGGSLQQSAEKVHKAIVERASKLKQMLGGSEAKINLNELLSSVEKDLSVSKVENFGFNKSISGAVNNLRQEIVQISKDGIVDLSDAQAVKRAVGKLGSWVFGNKDADASALEKVANELYTKLKVAIEEVSPSSLKVINKELSELLPIENAIIRRIPVASRNNLIGLGDILTSIPAAINPANIWLFALNRATKSGAVASFLDTISAKFGPEKAGAIRTILFGSPK